MHRRYATKMGWNKACGGHAPRIAVIVVSLVLLMAGGSAAANDPDLVVIEITPPDQISVRENIQINWTVKNQGDGQAIPWWPDRLYLSNDTILDDSDAIVADYWVLS